jgi:AraC-like DNA-binding protein
MADGSASPPAPERTSRATAGSARPGLGATVWAHPRVHIERHRSWRRVAATVFSRAAGEAYWRGEQHRLALYLTDLAGGMVQPENGRRQVVKTTAPRPQGFQPAGMGLTVDIPQVRLAQVIQSPEIYRDLACEVAAPLDLGDLEPMLSFDDPEIARLIKAIVNEIDGGLLDDLLVNALSTALAVQVARRFHGSAIQLLPAGRLSHARLKRVTDYIEDHLADPLSLSELAAIACLSPFHFSRCFKHSMSMGPSRYVVRRRIERARRLVLQSDMSLTDIAAATGFDSQSSFTERFRREVGISPGRLRRERA